MNERELDLALDRLGVEHVRRTAPSALRDRVQVVPLEIKRRSWLLPFHKWRFQPMFSATKFVVAGAIVALFGGYLLVAQPFDQQETIVPGATTDAAASREDAVSVITGHLDADYGTQGPVSSYGENLAVPGDGMEGRVRDETDATIYPDRIEPWRIEMADARLSGDFTFTLNGDGWYDEDCRPESETCCPQCGPALFWGAVLIENDGGTWEGTWSFVHAHLVEGDPATIVTDVAPMVMRLVGTRDYEGLSAILYVTWQPVGDPSVQGLVFPGNLPPDREVAAGTG